MTRKRKVLGIKLVSHDGRKTVFRIKTEAGTYIKELITGDNEKTVPSFSSLAGMRVACTNLEVVKIDDGFLKETMG